MVRRAPRFGKIARQTQARFRSQLSPAAQCPTDDKGLRHGHLLAWGSEDENLYPSLRGSDGAPKFFRDRKIKWWTSARSGDRPLGNGYEGPTRNLASSQVACVNFLLPLAATPGALVAFLRLLDDDIHDVVPIIDQAGRASLVEFEWVGWSEPLEGGRITRGANQTSIDAMVVGRTSAGCRAYLFEWKYCEEYLRPEDKSAGSKGDTRRSRYKGLFERDASPFLPGMVLDEFLFEPFYQIMRLILLGDRMLHEGVSPSLRINDVRVIVVCPNDNIDYRHVVPTTPLGRRFPTMRTVADTVRATIKRPEHFDVVAPEAAVAAMRTGALGEAIEPWTEYHRARYGW